MIWLGAVLAVALIGYAIWDTAQWSAFKAEHGCKIVGHMSGEVFNTFGVGSNGQMVVGVGSTPDKTGWLCDDGQTYWR